MPFKKKFLIMGSAAVLVLVAMNVLLRSTDSNVDAYISPAADRISYDDIKDYLKKIDFARMKVSDYLNSGKTVNRQTIRFFKYLQGMFRDMRVDDHIAAVREYLIEVMDPQDAEELLGYYKKFLEYENEAASLINSTGKLETADDYLRLLSKMKKMQVRYFGIEDAEMLFGAEIKAREYPVRRGAILYETNLYGKEKEEKIVRLNRDMWGDQADEVENSRKPYIRYQDKLSIYDRDLREMDENSRTEKIREFRKDIFPDDVVERLEAVDRTLALENRRNSEYKTNYEMIASDRSLSDSEKQKRIDLLRNRIYGDQAESVRQIEMLEKGRQELMDRYLN